MKLMEYSAGRQSPIQFTKRFSQFAEIINGQVRHRPKICGKLDYDNDNWIKQWLTDWLTLVKYEPEFGRVKFDRVWSMASDDELVKC